MEGYTKLFGGIVLSTMWTYDSDTRVMWVTLMALADQHGNVVGNVPGIAGVARVPVEKAREAIARFEAPDPDSSTPEFEGRRIEKIDRGWHLLTYPKYRELRGAEEIERRKEAARVRTARWRGKRDAGDVTVTVGDAELRSVTVGDTEYAQAPSEAEAEADRTCAPISTSSPSPSPGPTIPRPTELTTSDPPWPRYVKKQSAGWLLARWPSNGRNPSRQAVENAAEKSISARDWDDFEAATRARLRNVEESIAQEGAAARKFYPGLVKWFETWRDYPIPPAPANPNTTTKPLPSAKPIADERFSD